MMPVFNAGAFLEPALASLRAQTFGDWELTAIDDGSRDHSPEVLRKFAKIDERVCPIFQKENRGIPATRNHALDHMRGEFFAFLNHDDIAMPERFARQLSFLHANPEIDFVGCAIDNVDERGACINSIPMPVNELEIRWMALFDCPVRQSVLMSRAEMFQALRYDESIASNSDYDLISRAVRSFRATNLPETLGQYRKHPNNTSRVRRDPFVDNGAAIARRAIAYELPDFAITLEEIADIRAALLNYKKKDAELSVRRMNRAIEIYLDLLEAFREKYHEHPQLAQWRGELTPPE